MFINGMRTALVLALFVHFIFGDEICENTDGDLFFISNPIGSFMQHLKVDDHEYTVQIATPRGFGEESINLYFKEGFKSEDKIEINQQQFFLDLVGKYGFKDVELQRNIGFQKESKGPLKTLKLLVITINVMLQSPMWIAI